MILRDGTLQVVPREVGPEPLEKDKLGIGALPEQDIADALLAAGADQEIGIGYAGGIEEALELVLVDLAGIDDLGAAAIAEGHDEVELAVARRPAFGPFDQAHDIGLQAASLPDHAQPNALA